MTPEPIMRDGRQIGWTLDDDDVAEVMAASFGDERTAPATGVVMEPVDGDTLIGDGSGLALPPVDTDEVTRKAAEFLEAGHKPLLGPGAALFDLPRRFLLHRYRDEAGTTGVGAIAWGCLWPDDSVALHWQTEHAMKGGYYEDMETVLALHGNNTAVEWVDL